MALGLTAIILTTQVKTKVEVIERNLDSNTASTVKDSKIDDLEIGNPMDVTTLPSKINWWNLSQVEWRWFFTQDEVYYPLFYKKHIASFVNANPSFKKIGFHFYPEDHSLGDIVLAVVDLSQKEVREVYRGDTRTSNWEWKGDQAVIVKRSCGTGCMNAYVFDILTGKKIDEYRVY